MAAVIPFQDRGLLNSVQSFWASFCKGKIKCTSHILSQLIRRINYTSFFPFFSPSTSTPFLKNLTGHKMHSQYCQNRFALTKRACPAVPSLVKIKDAEIPLCSNCMCVKEKAVCVHGCVPSYTVCKLQVKNDCFKTFTLPHHDVGGGRREM